MKNVLTWMPHKEGWSVSIMNGADGIGNNKQNKKTTHRLGGNSEPRNGIEQCHSEWPQRNSQTEEK